MLLPTDFILTNILYDAKSDMQGYMGVLKDTIYVVFRGSSSIRNWIDDMEVFKTGYPYCDKCEVHKGFYKTSEALKIDVINEIKKMFSTNTNKMNNIIITGHSYGAAIATLISLELYNKGIQNKVYNFGQPRIGNKEFSKFSNSIMKEYYRFTHNRDMVPHVPPMNMGYYHSCGEIFEKSNGELVTPSAIAYGVQSLAFDFWLRKYGSLQICSKTECEDPKCSQQYTLKETNVADHMIYLGYKMECEASRSR